MQGGNQGGMPWGMPGGVQMSGGQAAPGWGGMPQMQQKMMQQMMEMMWQGGMQPDMHPGMQGPPGGTRSIVPLLIF